MAIFGIICLILLVSAGILIYLQKMEKIADRDNDFIPDVVEDTVKKTKKRIRTVGKEIKEAKKEIKLAAKEISDIAKAAAGKKTTKKRKKKVIKK